MEILLKEKRVVLSWSCLFLKGKENKGQNKMDTKSCRLVEKEYREKLCTWS